MNKKIKTSLDKEGEEKQEGLDEIFTLSKTDGTLSYRAPFRSEWFTANSACLNDELHLNRE